MPGHARLRTAFKWAAARLAVAVGACVVYAIAPRGSKTRK